MRSDSPESLPLSMGSHSTRRTTPALYRMGDPLSNAAFRGDVQNVAVYREMESAYRGVSRPSRIPSVRHGMGRRLCDFIWVSLIPIIHQRVVDLLTLAGTTGWAAYPVQVFDRQGVPVTGYHGLIITGRCQSMFLDAEHSEVVYEELPGGRYPYYKGLHITTDSWDGTDIFTAADGKTGWVVVTEKVKELFVKAKVTNVRLYPVSEVRVAAEDQPSFPRAATEAVNTNRPQ